MSLEACEKRQNHSTMLLSASSPPPLMSTYQPPSSLLLECHSTISNLKELLENLYNRIKILSYPLDFLENLIENTVMFNNDNNNNKVFYWPKLSPFFIAPAPHHAESVIMGKNNQNEKVFAMDLVDVSTSVQGDSDYIFYPSLVKILYDRQLKMSTPSSLDHHHTPNKLFTMRMGRGRFLIQPGSEFISSVEHDLFNMNSGEIHEKYGREILTRFGSDNRESMNHYPAQKIIPLTHKSRVNMREGMILNATGIEGGSIRISENRQEKVIVLVSSAYIRMNDINNKTQCNIYTQTTSNGILLDESRSKWFDINRLKRGRQSLCMLETNDGITIKFGRNARCIVYTSGRIQFNLPSVERLELWSNGNFCYFPIYYSIHSERLRQQYEFYNTKIPGYSSSTITTAAITLSDDDFESIKTYNKTLDSSTHRADLTYNQSTKSIEYMKIHTNIYYNNSNKNTDRPPILDQYGSFMCDFSPQFTILRNMRVQFEHNDIYPVFYLVVEPVQWTKMKKKVRKEKKKLSVVKETYKKDGVCYYVNGLYLDKQDDIIVYFYFNPKTNHIQFILPTLPSNRLNMIPILLQREI